jgi:hypothetical protein
VSSPDRSESAARDSVVGAAHRTLEHLEDLGVRLVGVDATRQLREEIGVDALVRARVHACLGGVDQIP